MAFFSPLAFVIGNFPLVHSKNIVLFSGAVTFAQINKNRWTLGQATSGGWLKRQGRKA
jgi:hypothetical protein